MHLNIKISKQFNLFQFVNNFSGWHFSCRKNYVDVWLEETGPLSKQEKERLDDLATVLSRYGFTNSKAKSKKYVNIYEPLAIVSEDRLKIELDKFIGEKDAKILKKTIEIFSSRFDKVWKKEGEKLHRKAEELEKRTIEKEIIDTINKLFPECYLPEEIEIFLQISTENRVGGGANIGPNRITLECSGSNNRDVIADVMWHEITHIMLSPYNKKVYESQKTVKLEDLDKVRKGGSFNPFSEAIVYGFFGGLGVLNKKYFPKSISQSVLKIANDGYKLVKTDRDPWKWLVIFLSEKVGKYYQEVLETGQKVNEKELGEVIATGIEDFKVLIGLN